MWPWHSGGRITNMLTMKINRQSVNGIFRPRLAELIIDWILTSLLTQFGGQRLIVSALRRQCTVKGRMP